MRVNALRPEIVALAIITAGVSGYFVGTSRVKTKQDVVAFRDPGYPGLVKRVVAALGDRVEVRDGAVYVNGLRQSVRP